MTKVMIQPATLKEIIELEGKIEYVHDPYLSTTDAINKYISTKERRNMAGGTLAEFNRRGKLLKIGDNWLIKDIPLGFIQMIYQEGDDEEREHVEKMEYYRSRRAQMTQSERAYKTCSLLQYLTRNTVECFERVLGNGDKKPCHIIFEKN